MPFCTSLLTAGPDSLLWLWLVRQAGSCCLSSHCKCAPVLRWDHVKLEEMSDAECPTAPQQPLSQYQHLSSFPRFLMLIKKNHLWRHVYSFLCQHRDFYLTGKTKVTLKKLATKEEKAFWLSPSLSCPTRFIGGKISNFLLLWKESFFSSGLGYLLIPKPAPSLALLLSVKSIWFCT